MRGRQVRGYRRAALALAAAVSLGVVACGGDDEAGTASGAAGTTAEQPSASASKCGLGNGQKASGEPIKLGALATKVPGTDLTGVTTGAKAYFDCVNDNGGIHGRPIAYTVETEQIDPQQIASLATKLWEDDGVLGFVGNASILDCAVNQRFYAQNDISAIVLGVPRQCFESPNIAGVNMGPYYTALGAAQYLEREGAKSLIAVTAKQPGTEYFTQGVVAFAKSKGLKTQSLAETVPITDASAVALKLADAAGDGGGVVLALTGPEAVKVLQAAAQQGVADKVKWACSTTCNDTSVPQALGPAWDGKLGVNAELNLVDSKGPDNQLYRQVQQRYAPDAPLSSFGQAGFLEARIATQALLDIKGEQYTRQTVNEAFRSVEGFKTDLLCKPWYFGTGEFHVPNNTDRTIVPQGDTFVQKEDCFEIAALPGNHLAEIRQAEEGMHSG
jgi:branched-chain amino acid transport system substrate-binding protein